MKGSANFLCKGNVLGFVGHTVCVVTAQHFIAKADLANIETDEHGCVLIKLYLWILEFEFHIIFTGYKILF